MLFTQTITSIHQFQYNTFLGALHAPLEITRNFSESLQLTDEDTRESRNARQL